MRVITQHSWLLASLLLAAMLLPIWIGRYAPLYDYPNHLLEAQVVVHYDDPQLDYVASYDINPGWYLRSNALSTLLLIGLGQMMPMTIAGQVVLSLYIALFLGGVLLLLRRAGTTWPLLLLAPSLAYNFTFTSGWLSFCYGLALGLYVLYVYLHWQEQPRRRHFGLLAFLSVLAYLAHLMVWGLLLVTISAMLAVEVYQWRRHGLLWLALNSALPLLFITRPTLAIVTLLSGPLIWAGAELLRRYRLKPSLVIMAGLGTAGFTLVMARVFKSMYQRVIPELNYADFDKLTFPLRLFTLPHQFLPSDGLLISYNLILLMLILVLGGLLFWSTLQLPAKNSSCYLVAIGVLGLLYVIIPSRMPGIWITEPRVLLLLVFITLIGVRLPAAGTPGRRAVTICAISLCLLSLSGTIYYAYAYDQRARAWSAQMAMLGPAKRVLTLRKKPNAYTNRPTIVGAFNRFYTGEYFSTIYALEHGGFASRIFNNGPVRPRQTILRPAYNWPGFRDRNYVAENCSALREVYDAVLFWGNPGAHLETQLNDCFTTGPRWPDMAIWWAAPAPEGPGLGYKTDLPGRGQ